MFSHRFAGAVAAFILLTASFGATSAASAQGTTDDAAGDVSRAIATIGADSVVTGEPVNVVLAGATSRHTLEIVGALAAAIGEHGQPIAWKIFHDLEGVSGQGAVIVIADGPGPGADISAVLDDRRATITFTGDARKLTALAYDLVSSQAAPDGLASTDVVLPNTWSPATLGDALDLIAGLAFDLGGGAPRLVTDVGSDPDRNLILVGDVPQDRIVRLAGDSAVPTILAYADNKAPVLVVASPAANQSDGLPAIPLGIVLVSVMIALFAWTRSDTTRQPTPVTA